MLRRFFLRIGIGEWAVLVIVVTVVVLVLFLVVLRGGESEDDTPALTPTPVPTHTLDVVAVPAEAADFRLDPELSPLGAYTAGITVTIDALPRAGWRILEWDGPVYDKSEKSAKIDMDSDVSVLVRFLREEVSTLVPTSTPSPTPEPVPTDTPMPTPSPIPTVIPTRTPTPTVLPEPTEPAATSTPDPTETPLPTPTVTPQPALLCGDADGNGELNTLDVVAILEFVVGNIDLNDRQMHQANVISGDLNAADADATLRHLNEGRADTLTCSFPSSSDRL